MLNHKTAMEYIVNKHLVKMLTGTIGDPLIAAPAAPIAGSKTEAEELLRPLSFAQKRLILSRLNSDQPPTTWSEATAGVLETL